MRPCRKNLQHSSRVENITSNQSRECTLVGHQSLDRYPTRAIFILVCCRCASCLYNSLSQRFSTFFPPRNPQGFRRSLRGTLRGSIKIPVEPPELCFIFLFPLICAQDLHLSRSSMRMCKDCDQNLNFIKVNSSVQFLP